MKVYSLLGFVDYEGSDFVGVFASVEDALQCVASRSDWCYDQMGYVESELGEGPLDSSERVEFVEFGSLYRR
jgi:hypothetical protein